MVEIYDSTEQVADFLDDMITLVLKVLWEDIFLEVIWNKLLVKLFVTLETTWGFAIVLLFCVYGVYHKYVEPYR